MPQPLGAPFRDASFRLRGMAVDQPWRGRGIGRELWQAAAELLSERGVRLCWANARDTALAFYVRLGWRVVGEGFEGEQGLPHHLVTVRVGRSTPGCGS